MAVENGWGGRESRQKSSNLADSVLSWFSQSGETLYIDDLENLLDEEMAVSFNTEIEDGSVEEVINDDANDSSDEEASDMVVDDPVLPKETVAMNKPKPREMPDEDGWSMVAPKRNRGRKPG